MAIITREAVRKDQLTITGSPDEVASAANTGMLCDLADKVILGITEGRRDGVVDVRVIVEAFWTPPEDDEQPDPHLPATTSDAVPLTFTQTTEGIVMTGGMPAPALTPLEAGMPG